MACRLMNKSQKTYSHDNLCSGVAMCQKVGGGGGGGGGGTQTRDFCTFGKEPI